MKLLILGAPLILAACVATTGPDQVRPTAQALTCLPKGVYLGDTLGGRAGFRYTEAERALIDVWRIANCDPLPPGYAPPASPVE